jgi:RHS repeat-associated protein
VQGNLLAVGLPSGTTVEYVVDGRNRRIGRKVNGTVTHGWLYQGQLRPVAELNAAGAIVSRFVYGARAVAPEYMIRGGVTYRFVTDHLGSVRLVVNNTSGVVQQRLDYDAWGRVVMDTNPGFQPFGYAGGLVDSATGVVRFGVRDYDAVIGRWLSPDPIRFAGADSNLFGYVRGDPVNAVDPSGRLPIVPIGIGILLAMLADATPANAPGRSDTAIPANSPGSLIATIAAGEGAARVAGYLVGAVCRLVGLAARGPARVYSDRVIRRAAEAADLNHNFPRSFDESIFAGTRQVVNDNYVLYTQRGFINNRAGTFEIGVTPPVSGQPEIIVHRFFRPDR